MKEIQKINDLYILREQVVALTRKGYITEKDPISLFINSRKRNMLLVIDHSNLKYYLKNEEE